MTLPRFEDSNPSIEKLWIEQFRLKTQADKLVKKTCIMGTFSRYGHLSPIGGSYEYDLMVYPDLDISLISNQLDKDSFASLVGELAANEYVRKISTADTVNFPPIYKGRPKGFWIGLEIPFENDRWGIDCWLQEPEWASADENNYSERLKSLEQSAKDFILQIKYSLIQRQLYGKKVSSNDVYDAVLDRGVRSIDAFNEIYDI